MWWDEAKGKFEKLDAIFTAWVEKDRWQREIGYVLTAPGEWPDDGRQTHGSREWAIVMKREELESQLGHDIGPWEYI